MALAQRSSSPPQTRATSVANAYAADESVIEQQGSVPGAAAELIWSALTRQRFGMRRLVAAKLATAPSIWPRQVAALESGDKSPHSKNLLLFLARNVSLVVA